jgi:adenine-specific DNA-methyltransferase
MTLFSTDTIKYQKASSGEYVFNQLIPYLGNKRKLLGLIQRALKGVPRRRFLDLFAGSGVVSRMAKQLGFSVLANDWEPYATAINRCYIECNEPPSFFALGGYHSAISTLNELLPREGWITETLCPKSDKKVTSEDRAFFTRANGERLDAMRRKIQFWRNHGKINDREEACLLAPILYAASYVSNTSGVFKGFHNGWGGTTSTAIYRILSKVSLAPAVFFQSGRSHRVSQQDARVLAESLQHQATVAYLDPPYNQHPYGSNYHVLNSITKYDNPEAPGRSAIRPDWKRSPYNYRNQALSELQLLVSALRADHILLSYSTDGIVNPEDLVRVLASRGRLEVYVQPHKRYRVSPTRRSASRHNLEFILSVDTSYQEGNSEQRVLKTLSNAQAFID